MIEIVNGENKVKVAETMTVQLYQKFQLDKQSYEEDPINFISLFTGLTKKELKNTPKKTIDLLSAYLQNQVIKDTQKELVLTFIHNDVEYGLDTDFANMAWGAWIDLEVYTSQDINNNIHKILSVLYRPVISKKKTKYNIEPYDSDTILERAEIFLNLPISIWLGVADFFLTIADASITNINSSLEWKIKMLKMMRLGTQILPRWLQKRLLRGFTLN